MAQEQLIHIQVHQLHTEAAVVAAHLVVELVALVAQVAVDVVQMALPIVAYRELQIQAAVVAVLELELLVQAVQAL